MSKKILVCDDDEGISEMIKIMLEEEGYEVKLLSTGKGIQKRIKEYSPNLILLDLWMPGIAGEETALLLKRDQEIKKIPIIIISALGEGEVKKIVEKTSVEGFLSKPFNMVSLISIVAKYTSV